MASTGLFSFYLLFEKKERKKQEKGISDNQDKPREIKRETQEESKG